MSAWIKMNVGLRRHPHVVRIASALRLHRLHVVGALHAVWSVFDEQSTDGHLPGYSFEAMDEEIGLPGFCAAMEGVGWLARDGDCGLQMPEFERHNGASAKRRAQESDRKRSARASADGPQDGGNASASDADRLRTRIDKRRTTPVAKATGVPAERGTRLPDDWQLPKAWGEWALQERPDWTPEDVRRVALAFRNHWVAKAGRDATKRDWSATWQNWVLKEPRPRPGAGPRAGKQADLEARNRAAGDAFEQGGVHAAA